MRFLVVFGALIALAVGQNTERCTCALYVDDVNSAIPDVSSIGPLSELENTLPVLSTGCSDITDLEYEHIRCRFHCLQVAEQLETGTIDLSSPLPGDPEGRSTGQAFCDSVVQISGEWYYEFTNARFQVYNSIQPNCWPLWEYVVTVSAEVPRLCCTSGGAWRQCRA